MSAATRQQRILVLLRERRQMSIAELQRLTGASAATVRRDLQTLEDQHLLLRVHGGVIESPSEPSVPEKYRTHVAEKQALGRLAASCIHEGEVVLLDAGTTTGAITRELAHFRQLTVVTNAVNILVDLLAYENLEVIMLGGTLRQANQAVMGSLTEDNLRHIRPDRAFMGAYGVNLDAKVMVSATLSQAYLKGAMMRSARHVYVVVDHTKLDESHHGFVTPLPDDATLLVDAGITESQRQALSNAGLPHRLAPVASAVV